MTWRLRFSIDVISDGFSLRLIGRFHSPIVLSFLPVNTRTTFSCIPHSSMSNVTLHPESVNFLVDMRDEWEIPGTICASITVFGSHRMSKLHVCVDCIIFPLRSVIFNGDGVNFFSDYRSSLYQKIYGSS